MGRRLVEATKACRTRRTRGETGLCFFLVLEAASFLLAGALLVETLLGGEFLAGLLLTGVLSDVGDELDWANASDDEPNENRKKIAAKITTAKLRTQTLPTAESWHP
jgi:hypothetical protein